MTDFLQKFDVPKVIWFFLKNEIPQRTIPKSNRGRKRLSDKVVLRAVLLVLFTNQKWKFLDEINYGCRSSTAYKRFKFWEKNGFFDYASKWKGEYQEFPEDINWVSLHYIHHFLKDRVRRPRRKKNKKIKNKALRQVNNPSMLPSV